jgi:hypothetical protein
MKLSYFLRTSVYSFLLQKPFTQYEFTSCLKKILVSHLFQIWLRPWPFLYRKFIFPLFKKIQFFAPQFLLSYSPKTLYSVPLSCLCLKNKFLVLATCFIFGLALKASFQKFIPLPSFKKLFPFFAPQFSLSPSPKTLQ